ncbi:MAG TPA: hypothetical protein VK893_13040, partial [Pyrinomonadaceae bacterium]|nr:hypothetical protein [Pyrinomonadaceae bacterium]
MRYYGFISGLILSFLLVPAVCAQKKVQTDPNKSAVIIVGAGGEPEYAKQFETWTRELRSALSDRFGFDAQNLTVLPNAKATDVRDTFAQLKSKLNTNNVLFVFLIGHGSFDGQESKFNLVGPDLAASEYNTMLTSLPTKRIVVFNMASASGEFVKSLSAKGRIVITATRSGQETNATRFAGFFIAALNATDADTDQDGHTSVLETFVYANRLTADFYTRAGRLATEHALLDD